MKKILFVCTGNTCRSPMAQAVFNSIAPKGFTAVSAGLASDGSPLSENSRLALSEYGIHDFSHISTPVTQEILRDADRVFCVSKRHAMFLSAMYPEYTDKIEVFPNEIPDPYGGDISVYREALKEIAACIGTITEKLCKDERGKE